MLSSDYSLASRNIIEQGQWMEVSSSCDSLPICLQNVLLLLQQAEIGADIAEDLILFELNFFWQSLFAHNDYQLIIIQICSLRYKIHIISMKNSLKDVIIMNADDYGYNETTNNGIIDLITKRKVNSTSVIVNGNSADSAALKIKQIWKERPILRRKLSVGLHFNLTEGAPLSKQCLTSPIVQNELFIGKPRIYDILQKADICQNEVIIKSELHAQIRKFIQLFGRRPSHIDGHNHVHIIPIVAGIVAEQMYALGIFRTRIPLQNLENISIKLNRRFLSYAKISRDIYQSYKILSANDFVGLENFGNLDPFLIERSLQKQSNTMQRSVQMMCHPAYPAQSGIQWTKSIDRLREKQQLESEQFERLLEKYSDYGNYYDLKRQITTQSSILIHFLEKIHMDDTKRNQIISKMLVLGFETYFYCALQKEDQEMNFQDLRIIVESLNISIIVEILSFEIKVVSEELDQITKDKFATVIKTVLQVQQTEVKEV